MDIIILPTVLGDKGGLLGFSTCKEDRGGEVE